MIPLKCNRIVLTWLCVYPPDEGSSDWTKRAQKIFTIFVFIYNILAFSVTIFTLAWYIERDPEKAIFVIIQTAGGINMVSVPIIITVLRRKITAMINHLDQIYEICKFNRYHFAIMR